MAERAGVTKQTVSNVVTGRVRVRPETAAKVRAAIEELGYRPNLVARSLATGATRSVGLFVPTVASAFYSKIVEEVENVLEENGYHLLLCTTRHNGDRAKRHMAGLSSRNVDGLLIAGDLDLVDHLPVVADAKFPIALCAWESEVPDSLPVVSIDYEQAGYLAGRHLRELGHERVGVLASLPAHDKRLAGFRRAFAADGRTVHDAWVFSDHEPTALGGFQAAAQAITELPGMTALFATHDVLTLGALEAARAAARTVPADLSIIGLDDITDVAHTHPAVTTVAIPAQEMARQATELLLRSITESRKPPNALHLLRPTLILRASTTRLADGPHEP
ncbi:LacI family DNA-binding transcriptional regulator [Actinocorallia lasiicapitis]